MLMFMMINFMSMIFMFMKHPLSMGMILFMQTLNVAVASGLITMNFWFTYIIFLIMIGGMMVLFIYMTSVASNEKFNKMGYKFITLMVAMATMIFMFSIKVFEYTKINLFSGNIINVNKFINFPMSLVMMMMIIYLFITLIAIVKISKISSGPLQFKF
uniref:NADH-ubiquinone oxidoreductase chain 6 n=1 Tax=Histeroidea sp. 5 KM-2017 TaxID=2219438 RepID=A0A346RGV0_9COLE|nr:NADH dehydrogenase subunit 6 [Histeroidea sp. 5 KM-2017]